MTLGTCRASDRHQGGQANGLDPQQLLGEYYALSNNQLEPVQAQSYQPDLGTPYDISLQDQLNANQADFNATQRMVGYNPAALAQLNAQKYGMTKLEFFRGVILPALLRSFVFTIAINNVVAFRVSSFATKYFVA